MKIAFVMVDYRETMTKRCIATRIKYRASGNEKKREREIESKIPY